MPRNLVLLVPLLALACAEAREPPPEPGEASPPAAAGARDGTSAAPADARPVVVFLGTSLTAGLGLARPEDTYVARVAELADSAGLPIHAVNAGVSGETSAGGLRRIDWVLRGPLDVLVLELGANDGLRGLDPREMEENLRGIIDRTRARYPGATIVLAGMEAPPNLGPVYTEAFRSAFTSLAAERGTLLVPFLLDGVAGVTELNQADGIHPTPGGHRIMARTLWPALERALHSLPRDRAVAGDGRR